MKHRMYFFLFSGLLTTFNIIYFMLLKYIYFQTETGFSSKVPKAIAENAVLKTDFERFVFFNFSIIMMIGKLFAFTYLPFGMAKYVSVLILPELKPQLTSLAESLENRKDNTCDNKYLRSESFNKERTKIQKMLNNGFGSSSDYTVHKNKKNNNNLNNSYSFTTCNKLDNERDNEDSDFLISESTDESKENKVYLNNSSRNKFKNINKKDILTNNTNNLNKSFSSITIQPQQETKAKTDKNLIVHFFKRGINLFIIPAIKILYTFACIFLLFGIIETKIFILYSKQVNNICGSDCGYLSFRYDKIYTLETLVKFLTKKSENFFLELDFFFFCLIISFRILTVYNALLVKGVAFLTFTFYKIEKNISSQQIVLAVWTILFVGIIILHDVNYLIPDYIRFNGLPENCDYTMINDVNCGISYFGLILIKLNMNFHILMYYDMIASFIFIVSGLFWTYRLILKPLYILFTTKKSNEILKS